MFDASSATQSGRRTLPENTLTFGKLKVEGINKSAAGNQYMNVTVICEKPYAGHEIKTRIMLTQDGAASARGMGAVRSILEANGLTVEANPDAFRFSSERDVAKAIHQKRCAVKTRLNDKGYDDVRVWLSPSQASGTVNEWAQLNAPAEPAAPAVDDALPDLEEVPF